MVASVAIIGSGTVWFQVHSAAVAKDEKEAAALQLQMKRLELEEMKIRNDKAIADMEAASSSAAKIQAALDRCVKDTFAVVHKDYGTPSKSAVVADCKRQYASADGSGMAAVSSASDTGGDGGTGGGGGVNSPALLGLVAGGALALALFARKGKKAEA
ncbi:hypothetical protein ACFWEB_26155 [Streptomyces parvus]|uniref:hypothetical protein n=1 Tax=Streptomyces parvus TaxID=66428 RepID=UPI003649728C